MCSLLFALNHSLANFSDDRIKVSPARIPLKIPFRIGSAMVHRTVDQRKARQPVNDRPHGVGGVFTGTSLVLVSGERLHAETSHITLEKRKNRNRTYFITVSTNEMLRSLNYGFEHFGQWLRRGRRRRLFQRRRRLPRGRQWRLLAERIVHVKVLVPRLQRHVL